jgi:single-strand DNA-binding protein
MLNRIVLVGRLTKEPELRFTNNNNIPVVSFTLAVNRPFSSSSTSGGNDSNSKEADFIPCIAWRKQAENVSKYVKKGHMVAVDGRIQTRDYVDTATNTKRYITEVVCDSVVFLETKGSSDNFKPFEKEIPNEKENDKNIQAIEDDLPF